MQALIAQCEAFIRDELKKRGFQYAILGLSGGIDSALVCTLAVRALGADCVYGLILPSTTSSQEHFNDAKNLAKNLCIHTEIIALEPFEKAYAQSLENEKITESALNLRRGNFCARMRMSLLYDRAILRNALVLGTSNKSEIMLGYGTIYGDLACSINPIGSFYKSEIFALARALRLPQNIINKKPSADLFTHQTDEADLGYEYSEIDKFLRAFNALDFAESSADSKASIKNALIAQGFEKKMTQSLCGRIFANAFKSQMPSIFQPK